MFLIVVLPAGADAEPQMLVVLHSYHQGYEWTNAVNAGIHSVLSEVPDLDLAYEYLDAQRSPRGSFTEVARLLGQRYAQHPPAAVIAVDDDALHFLVDRSSDLFAGVPVAYCGINDVTAYEPEAIAGMTGVSESPDIEGSLQLALRLFPKTSTVFVVADETTSGIINMRRFTKVASSLPAGITVMSSVGRNRIKLSQELAALPANAIVLYLSYLRTEDGTRMTVKESVSFVTGASQAPVFGCWDFIVEAGAFGGHVVSGRLQGTMAAERALRLVNREPTEGLTQTGEQSYESVLRFDQLKHFRVNTNNIPGDAVILGKPDALPRYIGFGIISLVAIVVLESMSIIVAMRSRSLLAAAESRYRILAEQLPAIVYSVELGRESKTSYVSPRLTEMLGYDPEKWLADPRAWTQAVHPDDRERLYAEAKAANEAGTPVSFYYRAVTAGGEIKYIKNLRAYYPARNGARAIVGAWMDVTQERNAQEHIRAALEEKELLLKEIHHRVKNNFQIVTSLLRLEYERIPDSLAHEVLRETERRIFAMALVHERLYQEGDLGRIDFKPYANRIGKELLAMTGNDTSIAFTVEGDELSLGIDRAVPLGLFINEALMNAFKHAFPEGFSGEKSIRVIVGHGEEYDELLIRDSGIGFDPGLRPQPDSSSHTESSLGLTLMALLTDQLGGTLTITTESGTIIQLKLPCIRA